LKINQRTTLYSFPEKKYWGNLNENFLKKRQNQLEKYLSSLSLIPNLIKEDYFIHTFGFIEENQGLI
jgi:hypothetical protein